MSKEELMERIGFIFNADDTPHRVRAAEKLIDQYAYEYAERAIKPIEFEYEGFTGCDNINSEFCSCATHTDPQCYYCEREIEPGQVVLVVSRWGDPFSEENAGWESIYAHKECPEELSSHKEEEREI